MPDHMVKAVRAMKRREVMANASTTITVRPCAAKAVHTTPIVYDMHAVKVNRRMRLSGEWFLKQMSETTRTMERMRENMRVHIPSVYDHT